jgi:ABC-type nitrate/sulfonate/bicarbonate transport system substrate-binding protein
VQFITAPPMPVMLARANGADVRMIAVVVPAVPFSLYTNKSVTKPSELSGAAGISFGPGSLSYFVAQLYLPALGVDPASITWTASRDMASQLLAVSQGQAKLTFLPDNQQAKAEELGVKMLVSSSELSKIAKFPYAGITTTSAYLKKSPDVVRKALMALGEATVVLHTKPKAAAAAIMKWNPGYTQEYADAAVKDAAATTPLVPSIDPKQIEVLRKLLVATGTKEANSIAAADFYDDSIVKSLDQSGFYKK